MGQIQSQQMEWMTNMGSDTKDSEIAWDFGLARSWTFLQMLSTG